MLNLLLNERSFWVDPMVYILGGFILLFALMMVFQTRRRKNAQTQFTGMLDTLRPGTRVKTVGGVIGRIKEIREEAPGFKTVLLETGTAPNTSFVLYDIQAIYGVVNDDKLASHSALSTPPATSNNEVPSVQDHTSSDNRVNNSQGFQETKKTKSKSK